MPSGRLPKKYLLAASALLGLALAGVLALVLPGTSDSSAVATLPLLKVDRPAIASISALHGASGLPASLHVGAATLGELAASQDAASATKPANESVGASELNRGRVLQSGLGSGAWSIYAYPTTAGHVCYGLTGVGAGCIPGFLHGFPVSFNVIKPDTQPAGSGAPLVVYGLAPDDVRGVTVNTSSGETFAATVANNSYFAQLFDNTATPSSVKSLIVTFTDGTTATITNDWPGSSK